jgi:hypothetical protein
MSALAVTISEADSYTSERQLTDWSVDNPTKTAALWRGQTYIAGEYNLRWNSTFENSAAPIEIKYAIIEAALAELKSKGSLSPISSSASAKVLTEVKGIKWTPLTVKGSSDTNKMMKPILSVVEALLVGLVRPRNSPSVLVV